MSPSSMWKSLQTPFLFGPTSVFTFLYLFTSVLELRQFHVNFKPLLKTKQNKNQTDQHAKTHGPFRDSAWSQQLGSGRPC